MSLKSGLASFFLLQFGSLSSSTSTSTAVRRCNFGHLRPVPPSKRAFTCLATSSPQSAEKVKISGGGRCNVTNGHCPDTKILAEHYPRGHRELRGSFFNTHGPGDTMSWFTDHGVALKIEEDGRVFPITNNSSSIVDCLLSEARERGGKTVTSVSAGVQGKFILKVEKRSVEFLEYLEADYLLIASGGSRQGYDLAVQLGHSIVDGVPSLFTFKIKDPLLSELSGCLDAALLMVDFVPDLHIEDMKSILSQQKQKFAKQKVLNSCPSEFGIVKRFWKYMLDREGQYKDEFVTAGGVPLSEISLKTMESKIRPNLFFAGEVLNVDGVTGGFNFQNAWSGGYIAGTTIGELAAKAVC
ncbi:unnamed protein product [Linum tenue]|uniref:RsdA/BaiN/AoA(So)-like Rossmann fold-like domain-containing protein n=1 Tax=Linum tenue TaxID=586396 RepID=A0AAV0N4L9_9ROSI|nr:unnamed protein product [Linum tenue]